MAIDMQLIITIIKIGAIGFIFSWFLFIILWILAKLGVFKNYAKHRAMKKERKKQAEEENKRNNLIERSQKKIEWLEKAMNRGYKWKKIRQLLIDKGWQTPHRAEMKKLYFHLKAVKGGIDGKEKFEGSNQKALPEI